MAFKQVLDTTQDSTDFTVTGESLLILSQHSGGTWKIGIIAPDSTLIDTGFEGNANFQQRIIVPKGTNIRLSGGTAGAKAWIGQIYRDSGGVLL